MNYYINYDSNDGSIIGFYGATIFSNTIPEPKLALTEAEYKDLVENNVSRRIVNGQVTITSLSPPVLASEDWKTLITSLRATPLFYKLYNGAKSSLPLNVAYTTMLNSFNMQNVNDLRFALAETKNMTDPITFNLTQSDVDMVNTLLTDNNFNFTV